MVTLKKFKSYLRIDGDYEDDLLNENLKVARAYLSGAISNYYNSYSTYPEFAAKADLLTLIIAAEFYQNRENSAHDMSYTVRSMIAQLQYFAGATGNLTFALFDNNGNLVDSKIYANFDRLAGETRNTSYSDNSQAVDDEDVATDAEANEYFDDIFGRLG